jgi:alkanesulfonate monooxygenase SsuD/methylene tetrahydromethanopterin reductase-like flavin-dependent oxidoreductase (luciferase family)
VKFGLALSVQHRPQDAQAARFREHLAQATLARSVGFSSIWASQHYLSAPFTYFQPVPMLARVAAEVDGLTLGTGVLVLPLYHPLEAAEQLATLDVICGGRLIAGVGLGYRDPENETFGLGIEELSRDRFIVGDPAEVRDEIARYRDRLGATMMIFRVQWPGLEQAAVLRSIRLLGEQVLPYFE